MLLILHLFGFDTVESLSFQSAPRLPVDAFKAFLLYLKKVQIAQDVPSLVRGFRHVADHFLNNGVALQDLGPHFLDDVVKHTVLDAASLLADPGNVLIKSDGPVQMFGE